MSDNDTSTGAGATPTTSVPPATGTNASGATPEKQSATTLEEALAEIAELKRHSTNKAEEAARHGKNLSDAQKKLAAYEEKDRLAQEAALSESQKMEKRATEAERLAGQYKQQLISAQVKLAAQALGVIDPEMAALAVQNSLEYDDNGMPSNLEDALKALIKSKPYLAPKPAEPAQQTEQTSASPAQTAQKTVPPQIPAMYPGRTSIQSPGSLPPGKPATWNDVFKRP